MNYREIDKTYLKKHLDTIIWDGKPLPVFTKRTVSNSTPYCMITSAEANPNEGSGSMYDNGQYMRGYEYNIYLVWDAPVGEAKTQLTDENIDELEALIFDLLQESSVRDCKELQPEIDQSQTRTNKWLDLVINGKISAPTSGLTVQLTANHMAKRFPIKIKHPKQYV